MLCEFRSCHDITTMENKHGVGQAYAPVLWAHAHTHTHTHTPPQHPTSTPPSSAEFLWKPPRFSFSQSFSHCLTFFLSFSVSHYVYPSLGLYLFLSLTPHTLPHSCLSFPFSLYTPPPLPNLSILLLCLL